MRTAAEIAQVQADAKIVLSQKGNEYAYALTQGIQSEDMAEFYAIDNAIEALSSQTLTLFQLNAIADFLVEKGYYLSANAALYNELLYDAAGYTSV
jgi:hypothetical protein